MFSGRACGQQQLIKAQFDLLHKGWHTEQSVMAGCCADAQRRKLAGDLANLYTVHGRVDDAISVLGPLLTQATQTQLSNSHTSSPDRAASTTP